MQVRRGSGVSNEEILAFAKLFNDELTLDNISRLVTVTVVLVFELNTFLTLNPKYYISSLVFNV